jgi:Fur family transcriptional regulator, ferric uptake regulator
MTTTRTSFKSELNEKGWRLTPQREKILHLFEALPRGEHLSAEDLHLRLKKNGEAISLSTIYRTAKVMARMGILRELELAEGHKHYELNTASPHHHHHIVCIQCNRTIEFEHDGIVKQGIKQAEKAGLHLIDCQLTLHAICPEAIRRGYPALPENWICAIAIASTPQPQPDEILSSNN